MRRLFFLILPVLLFSCQTLPSIQPFSPDIERSFTCPFPFLRGNYRLVHAIESRMPANRRSSVIGITLVEPLSRSVSCAIMTPEGMVLFEARETDGKLKIKRALPPFDSETLAQNMMEDIKLTFLPPQGEIQHRGSLSDGSTVCRYLEENGDRIDLIESKPNDIQLKRYSSSGVLKRHVRFTHKRKNIYQRVELRAKEIYDYSLVMNLIESERLKHMIRE